MEITLSIVRTVLRKALGFESFTARFIERVKADPAIETAAINKDGTLCYNPEFVEKYVKTPPDLFSLIFHETLHHVFGHFIYNNGHIENIAGDAIINATISQIYEDHSAQGDFFQRFYPRNGITGLLRPKSDIRNSPLQKVYEALYRGHRYYPGHKMCTGELIQTLRIILPTSPERSITFLGNHELRQENGLPTDTIASIAADIKQSLKNNSSRAGYSEVLEQLFIEVLDSRLSLSRKFLERYTTKRKIERFRKKGKEYRRTTSPIPLLPSKRDMVLLAAGSWPGYFHKRHVRPAKNNTGLAVYLDVSGSMKDYLPEIIGAIAKLSEEVPMLYTFSNLVVETTLKDLIKGNIDTTWGTDFDCVARSIIKKDFDKAVVVTDGYANLDTELSEELKRRKVSILTILFGGRQDCPEFEPFGEVIQLDDIH